MVLAVVRGILLGGAAAVALGAVVSVGATVHGWPAAGGSPEARARHLGQGISWGMTVTTLAGVIAVPAAVVWSVRRRRPKA